VKLGALALADGALDRMSSVAPEAAGRVPQELAAHVPT